jgi:hypothetical protein
MTEAVAMVERRVWERDGEAAGALDEEDEEEVLVRWEVARCEGRLVGFGFLQVFGRRTCHEEDL